MVTPAPTVTDVAARTLPAKLRPRSKRGRTADVPEDVAGLGAIAQGDPAPGAGDEILGHDEDPHGVRLVAPVEGQGPGEALPESSTV